MQWKEAKWSSIMINHHLYQDAFSAIGKARMKNQHCCMPDQSVLNIMNSMVDKNCDILWCCQFWHCYNSSIDVKYLSIPIIADQCRSIRIWTNNASLIGIDQHWWASRESLIDQIASHPSSRFLPLTCLALKLRWLVTQKIAEEIV